MVLPKQAVLPILVVRVGRDGLDDPDGNLESIAERLEGDGIAVTGGVGHGAEVRINLDGRSGRLGMLACPPSRNREEIAVQIRIHPYDVKGQTSQIEIGTVPSPKGLVGTEGAGEGRGDARELALSRRGTAVGGIERLHLFQTHGVEQILQRTLMNGCGGVAAGVFAATAILILLAAAVLGRRCNLVRMAELGGQHDGNVARN